MNSIRTCFKCIHYNPFEDRIGYCKIFGCIKNARENGKLCGKYGVLWKKIFVDIKDVSQFTPKTKNKNQQALLR